jgi:type IV secretory pathway component VirB8
MSEITEFVDAQLDKYVVQSNNVDDIIDIINDSDTEESKAIKEIALWDFITNFKSNKYEIVADPDDDVEILLQLKS